MDVYYKGRRRKAQLVGAFISCLLLVALAGCGKTDLIRVNADAINSLSTALKIADAAYTSGAIKAETQREILTTGERVGKVLVEVNEFAASLPDGQAPSSADKAKILTSLDAAISHLSKLVAQGAFFTGAESQKAYYRFARPAQAAVVSLKAAILKLQPAERQATPPASQS